MAVIGERLDHPEEGWKRYDDEDSNIYYTEKFITSTSFAERLHYIAEIDNNEKIKFHFVGSKLRLYGAGYKKMPGENDIYIDGKVYHQNYRYTDNQIILTFEIENMDNREHLIEIKSGDCARIYLNAIDIDESGSLISEEEYNRLINERNKKATIITEDRTIYKNIIDYYGDERNINISVKTPTVASSVQKDFEVTKNNLGVGLLFESENINLEKYKSISRTGLKLEGVTSLVDNLECIENKYLLKDGGNICRINKDDDTIEFLGSNISEEIFKEKGMRKIEEKYFTEFESSFKESLVFKENLNKGNVYSTTISTYGLTEILGGDID